MDPRVGPLDDDLVSFTAPVYPDELAGFEDTADPGYRFVSPGELPWPTRRDAEAATMGFWDEADEDRRAGPHRRPRRHRRPGSLLGAGDGDPRRRGLVIGALVLVAVLVAGVVIGRSTAVAPAGVEAGPARRDGAIPSGFARTSEGATAAAADFAALVATPALSDPASMSATLAAIAAPGADFADAAASAVEGFSARLAETGVKLDDNVTFRTFPLTAHVRRYTESFADVEVWAASVVAVDGSRGPGAAFVTYRFALAWSDGDWRVEDLTVRATPQDPVSPAELVEFAPLQYGPVASARIR